VLASLYLFRHGQRVSARYSEGLLFRRFAIPRVPYSEGRYSETMWRPYTFMLARRALDSAVAELFVILVSFNGFPENIVLVLIILKLVG